jgi:hypothetical protein
MASGMIFASQRLERSAIVATVTGSRNAGGRHYPD